jgi:hypothetical protein
MESTIHEVCPLIVYQGLIKNHEEFKEKYLDELRDYWFNGYVYESPECSGKIFAHLNENYSDFFSELKRNIDGYFDALSVDHSKLSYHVVKTWVGYHGDNETPSVSPHTHNESNLSFVYYLKTDPTSDKFCVSVQGDNKNECMRGLFETAEKYNLITKYNRYNCSVYTITPVEGSVVIFPSNIGHFTQQYTERADERIVVAGDIRVTLHPDHYMHHQGSTHPLQWKSL